MRVLEAGGFTETTVAGLGTNGKRDSPLIYATHVDDYLVAYRDRNIESLKYCD